MSTIFITGASSGTGRATALLFAERGWKVIAAARDFQKAPEVAATAGIQTVQLDVTNPDQIRTVVAEVLAETPVDVLYNNAGALLVGPTEAFSDEQLERQIAVNLLGPIRVSRAFIPAFRERRSGLIINTTSLTAVIAGPFMSVYGATKAGLERWSFGMNLELNEFGIRVKTIIPGIVNTNLPNNATIVRSEPYAAHAARFAAAFATEKVTSVVSEPSGTAAVVFEAATDGTDRIRYLTDKIARDQGSTMDGRRGAGAGLLQPVDVRLTHRDQQPRGGSDAAAPRHTGAGGDGTRHTGILRGKMKPCRPAACS